MRSRNIKPGWLINEDLLELPFEYRILFAGLWMAADSAGRLEDRPKKIKIAVFPGDDVDCDDGLKRLAEKEFIQRYQIAGKKYIQITNFLKHQNPHYREKLSTLPGPDDGGSGTGQREGNTRESPGLSLGETESSTGQSHGFTQSCPADSLIPDSGFLIPDSVAAATKKNNAENVVQFVQKVDKSVDKSDPAAENAVQKPIGQNLSNCVNTVFEYWRRRLVHEGAKLGDGGERIERALGWGYSVDQLCSAIDGIRLSRFHMGDNESHTRHDGLKIILKDAEQIDKFIQLSYSEGVPARPNCRVHPQSGLTDWGTCWACYSESHGSESAGD